MIDTSDTNLRTSLFFLRLACYLESPASDVSTFCLELFFSLLICSIHDVLDDIAAVLVSTTLCS